jgi:hypothetical protein
VSERHGATPDLAELAARKLATYLEGMAVGSPLPLDSSSDVCNILELLIPQLLREEYPEWERESLDGFFLSTVNKLDERSAELVGTCILISDQTVTPFVLRFAVSDTGSFRSFRLRLGAPGGGPLGISGPLCTSPDAREMLNGLNERLDRINWTYELAV